MLNEDGVTRTSADQLDGVAQAAEHLVSHMSVLAIASPDTLLRKS